MTSTGIPSKKDNVVDLFTRKPLSNALDNRVIRIAPELDGLEMLYSNSEAPEKLFSIKVLAWGLRRNGDVVGLVPWLDELQACDSIKDDFNGKWEGYYDQGLDEIFYAAPLHKVIELETAADYFEYQCIGELEIIQEIPDSIGTHAAIAHDHLSDITFKTVVSWRLLNNGNLSAMLADDDKVDYTPVLPGDDCLYPAHNNPNFRYFFQHHVANQLKRQVPTLTLKKDEDGQTSDLA